MEEGSLGLPSGELAIQCAGLGTGLPLDCPSGAFGEDATGVRYARL